MAIEYSSHTSARALFIFCASLYPPVMLETRRGNFKDFPRKTVPKVISLRLISGRALCSNSTESSPVVFARNATFFERTTSTCSRFRETVGSKDGRGIRGLLGVDWKG